MSEEKRNEIHNDVRQFWLGAIIIASGVLMAFCALYINTPESPRGTISGSVLGYIGEAFTLGGACVGLVQYVRFKTKAEVSSAIEKLKKEKEEI